MANIILPIPTDVFQKDLIQSLTDYFNTVDDGIKETRRPNVKAITATYTITDGESHLMVDATSAAVILTLPMVEKSEGRVLVIKKIDASGNAVTATGDGVETIDGSNTKALSSQYDSVRIISDGTTWWII